MWIVKPGGLSRGRQIKVFRDYAEIIVYCKTNGHSLDVNPNKESKKKWVVQKYMENPKLLTARKFDFRVWVIVTSWNPYRVFYYVDCYLRLGSCVYSKDIRN
jgi:hypothetical protein